MSDDRVAELEEKIDAVEMLAVRTWLLLEAMFDTMPMPRRMQVKDRVEAGAEAAEAGAGDDEEPGQR